MRGDEHSNYLETEDNYAVVRQEDKCLMYAVRDEETGKMVATECQVKDVINVCPA